jgi:hypothetical protein
MPAIDEKKDMTKATRGGSNIDVSTPETGKRMRKKSIFPFVDFYLGGLVPRTKPTDIIRSCYWSRIILILLVFLL